jgi:hypothetical protein
LYQTIGLNLEHGFRQQLCDCREGPTFLTRCSTFGAFAGTRLPPPGYQFPAPKKERKKSSLQSIVDW